MKIIDPHLVSSFFDDFKRAYLHTSVKLENKSSWLAECALNIKVTSEIEGKFCLIEHLLTQELKIPPASHVQYTFPPVSICIFYYYFQVSKLKIFIVFPYILKISVISLI